MSDARSALVPYWRFRPDGEELVGDVMRCNWTCEGCSTKYGWRTVRPRLLLDPEQVVERLTRYGHQRVRIGGGEPTLYWMHLVGVANATPAGTHLTIETQGTLFKVSDLDAFTWLDVTIEIGLKATDPVGLAQVTGLPYAVAERRHKRQLENLLGASRIEGLEVRGTVLDKYASAGVVSALAERVPMRVLTYERFGDASRFYTPKRMRRK